MIKALLDGIWEPLGATLLIDNKLAGDHQETNPSGHDWGSVPHGTYLPIPFVRVITTVRADLISEAHDETVRSDGVDEDRAFAAGVDHEGNGDQGDGETDPDDVMVVEIYDERGAFGRFVWNAAANRWLSRNEPVTFAIAGGDVASAGGGTHYHLPDLQIVRYPSLTIARYSAGLSPHPSLDGQCHTVRLADGASSFDALPEQSLEYDSDAETLVWRRVAWNGEPAATLVFGRARSAAESAGYIAGKDNGQSFGDLFVAQNLTRLSAPFYGYNPQNMESYSSEELYQGLTTGTQAENYASNPNQSFNGALIFKFPKASSHDYVQATDLPNSPNVPFGVRAMPLATRQERTHTELVTTTRDQARATSMTFGLSAGLDKILEAKASLAFERKSEQQSKHQSRFTLSRKVAESWVAHLDVPSLDLHESLVGMIRSHLLHLLANPDEMLPWDADFVPKFGTHYAHALTLGAIEVAQTWFSLESEIRASESKISLSEEASATIEGAKIGASFSLSEQWKQQTGLEVSKEDTSLVGLGSDHEPAVIFHDLRPLSELMSPIFMPYDPRDDTWGRFAPWVWYQLRPNLEAYLESIGWNQPISPENNRDYTPRVFTVRADSFRLIGGEALDEAKFLGLVGEVHLKAADITAGAGPLGLNPDRIREISPTQFTLATEIPDYEFYPQPNITGGKYVATADNVYAGRSGGLSLQADVDLWVARHEVGRGTSPLAHFQAKGERIDLLFSSAVDPSGPKIAWNVGGVGNRGVRCTLEITLSAVYEGPLDNSALFPQS